MKKRKDKKIHSASALADISLVRKALAGDTHAYQKLFKKYYHGIYLLVRMKVPNHDIAEELTLEALYKAFSNLDTYSEEYAFSTWLYRIAINTVIDWFRVHFSKKERYTSISTVDIEGQLQGEQKTGEIQASSYSPDSEKEREEFANIIRTIAANLPEPKRKAIYLFFIENKKYREIAQETGLTIGSLAYLIYHTRKLLSSMINPKRKKEE